MFDLELNEIITLILIIATVAIQVTTRLKHYIVYMGAMAALLLTGVLDTEQAFSGFSNSTVVIIAILSIISAGIIHTGVVKFIVEHLLGTPKTLATAMLRMMIPVSALSAFIMDSALTSMMLGGVSSWSKRINISASKLLIPLSYAACMGGMLTLLGKVSNMVIAGNYELQTNQSLSIFAPTLFAVFCMIVGTTATIALNRLLPSRQSAKDSLSNASEFLSEFVVPADSRLIGMTLSESGIANIQGTALLKVIKRFDMETTTNFDSDKEYILGGDHLVFSGNIAQIMEHSKQMGLVPVESEKRIYTFGNKQQYETATAMITINSSLIGKTWSQTRLEQEQGFTLIAVARHSQRIEGSPHDIIFAAGDTLLIAHTRSLSKIGEAVESDLQFFDTEELIQFNWRTWASVAIVLLMVLLVAFRIMPAAKATILAAILMLATACCSIERAIQSIKWEVLLMLSGAIILGRAVSDSGLAADAANLILIMCGDSTIWALIALSLVSLLLANVIGNTTVASIFAPIVISTAIHLGCDPIPFCMMLMFSTTYCFATPTGCPPNVVVFYTCGYKYTDFLKIGLPVLFITWTLSITFLICYYDMQ